MTSAYKLHSPNGRHDPRTTYTTLSGVDIHFVPFSWDEYQLQLEGLREKYRQQGLPIDIPQYEVVFAGGKPEKFDHDEKSITQAPQGTPEEDKAGVIAMQQAAWGLHKETVKKFEAEDAEIRMEYLFLDSLGGITLPEDNAWEVRQLSKDIKIPSDPEEKRRHYILTILAKSRADQLDLMSTITAVSMGITKEADVEAIRSTFRNQLFRGIAQLLTAGEVEVSTQGQLAGESEIHPAASG